MFAQGKGSRRCVIIAEHRDRGRMQRIGMRRFLEGEELIHVPIHHYRPGGKMIGKRIWSAGESGHGDCTPERNPPEPAHREPHPSAKGWKLIQTLLLSARAFRGLVQQLLLFFGQRPHPIPADLIQEFVDGGLKAGILFTP